MQNATFQIKETRPTKTPNRHSVVLVGAKEDILTVQRGMTLWGGWAVQGFEMKVAHVIMRKSAQEIAVSLVTKNTPVVGEKLTLTKPQPVKEKPTQARKSGAKATGSTRSANKSTNQRKKDSVLKIAQVARKPKATKAPVSKPAPVSPTVTPSDINLGKMDTSVQNLDQYGKPKTETRLKLDEVVAKINQVNNALFEAGVRAIHKTEDQMRFAAMEHFSMEGAEAPTRPLEESAVAQNLTTPMNFNHRMQATLPFMDPDSTRSTEWAWLIRNEVGLATESTLLKYTSNSNASFKKACELFMDLLPVGYYKSPYTFRTFIQDPTFPNVPLAIITIGNEGKRPVIVATGDPYFIRLLEQWMKEEFFEPASVTLKKLVEITSQGPAVEEVSLIEGKVVMPTNEFYPFITDGPDKTPFDLKTFTEEFVKSNASITLFTGLPGTGKTTLARGIAMEMKPKSMVEASNSQTHDQPGFLSFLTQNSRESLIFIDDADLLVQSRERHKNRQMSGLLGLADGLDSTGVKIIICTNLASMRDVDTALLRSGRLFRKVEFRALTAEEANKARNSVGLPSITFIDKHEKNGLVLASALNYEHELSVGEHTDVDPKRVGF